MAYNIVKTRPPHEKEANHHMCICTQIKFNGFNFHNNCATFLNPDLIFNLFFFCLSNELVSIFRFVFHFDFRMTHSKLNQNLIRKKKKEILKPGEHCVIIKCGIDCFFFIINSFLKLRKFKFYSH